MLPQGNVPAVGSWHLLLRDCREAAAASTTLLRAAVTQLPAHLHGQGQMLGGIISTALQLGSFSHVEEKLLGNGQGSSKKTSNCRAEQDPTKHVGSTFSRSQTSCRHHGSKPSQQFSAAPRQPAPPRKPCCHREGSEELPTLLCNGSSATAAKITG